MLNQVNLEGFVISRWKYNSEKFLRIAHHGPQRQGELTHSDYITVRVSRSIKELPDFQPGDLVRVVGEVWGKDILEPLGKLFRKARLNVELPPELENLIVPRPTSYILARQISLVDSLEEAFESAKEVAGRPYPVRARKAKKHSCDKAVANPPVTA